MKKTSAEIIGDIQEALRLDEQRAHKNEKVLCGLCGEVTYHTYSRGVGYQICENMGCPLTGISLTIERQAKLKDYIIKTYR